MADTLTSPVLSTMGFTWVIRPLNVLLMSAKGDTETSRPFSTIGSSPSRTEKSTDIAPSPTMVQKASEVDAVLCTLENRLATVPSKGA